ncbi:MAG: tetratricopeptide repeat protein [Planctomycetaceae bacterium]|nr:tetratricopeptide repeat protein [Planctomycetaceae bacterium]
MSSRLEKLEAMLEADPSDTMARYMLAMEVDKAGDHDRSLTLFETLMQHEPPYVPAFLMAGQLLVRLGRTEEAKKVYSAGIAEARQQGNDHASGEMGQFLAELG